MLTPHQIIKQIFCRKCTLALCVYYNLYSWWGNFLFWFWTGEARKCLKFWLLCQVYKVFKAIIKILLAVQLKHSNYFLSADVNPTSNYQTNRLLWKCMLALCVYFNRYAWCSNFLFCFWMGEARKCLKFLLSCQVS